MPLYEYVCRSCEHFFDRLVPVAGADAVPCPSCGATEVRRLISVIAGVSGAAEAPAPVCGQGACGNCS